MTESISPDVVATLARATGMGLRFLGARIIAVVSLIMTFVLFSWAMWAHEWIAYTTATTFGIVIFLPALWVSRSKE